MADIKKLTDDFTQYKSDVTDAFARGKADMDALKAELAKLAPGTLTPEQQAAIDALDASITDGDATAKGFDVPSVPPTPVP